MSGSREKRPQLSRRISLKGVKEWVSRFEELLSRDKEAKKVLERWTSCHVPDEFIRGSEVQILSPRPTNPTESMN
jgi:hypothetical protein